MPTPPSTEDLAIPPALAGFAAVHLEHADGLHRIALMMQQDMIQRMVDEAAIIECAIALRRAAPTDRMLWSLTNPILFEKVPSWHWKMVQDEDRNAAYDRAIQASVQPGMNVLEIGAGTGLLAMMAARAGAGHVWTIELNLRMARTARACIAANGLSDRITVLTMKSTEVEIGTHLPKRCDLLIHEILSSNLLQEGVIPAVADARARLLVPNALLLPQQIWALGALSTTLAPNHYAMPARISGFDLSPLGDLAPGSAVAPGVSPADHLSDPRRLVEFDLTDTPADANGSVDTTLSASRAGTAACVAQWIGFGFPDGSTFEATQPTSCWGTFYHPFGTARDVAVGDTVTVRADYVPAQLTFGLAQS